MGHAFLKQSLKDFLKLLKEGKVVKISWEAEGAERTA